MVAEPRFVPFTVASDPESPELGVIEVMVGGMPRVAAVTVKLTELLLKVPPVTGYSTWMP